MISNSIFLLPAIIVHTHPGFAPRKRRKEREKHAPAIEFGCAEHDDPIWAVKYVDPATDSCAHSKAIQVQFRLVNRR
jgi:hypothetical protein